MSLRAQRALAIALAVFAFVVLAPFPLRDDTPLYGELPIASAPDGTVTDTDPRTGLKPGDRIEWAKVPLGDRYGSVRRPMVGVTVRYPFVRNGTERWVRLKPVPIAPDTPLVDKIAMTGKVAAWTFFALFALAIVLKHPSPLTWGFYVYALGNSNDSAAGISLLPTIPFHVVQFGTQLLTDASAIGLMVFALRFPHDSLNGWRVAAQRTVPWLLAAYAVFAAWIVSGEMTLTLDWYRANVWGVVAPFPPLLIAWVALLQSYFRSSGVDRIRLRWALLGIFIGTLLPGLAILLQGLTGGATFAFSESLSAFANVAVPLTMGYAIVRHRVIDVEFVVNRAIVLGTAAAVFAAAFVLLDWLFSNYVMQTRWQIAIGMAFAFALGWLVRSGRRRLTTLVDAVFFRKRHAIMRQVNDLRLELETRAQSDRVDGTLVQGAAQALNLDSAALFVRTPDGGFVRQSSVGWNPGMTWHLLAGDRIVDVLKERDRRARRVDENVWEDVRVPEGAARPVLAIPIGSARSAFVLYGAHADGRDIDPDETRGLIDLCAAAAAARAA